MSGCRTMLLPIPEGPVAAVVAHPDDETFGLGALLANLACEGREVRVLCFTHGEASTIGAGDGLGDIRRRELFDAAQVLGVADATLLDLPDGGLDALPDAELDAHIDRWLTADVAALVVLEPQGVTGHPDHQAVSRAAERVADQRGLPVVEWGIDPLTVSRLQAERGCTSSRSATGLTSTTCPLTEPPNSRRSVPMHPSSTTTRSSASSSPSPATSSASASASHTPRGERAL